MLVAVLQLDLLIPESQSLKSKRYVLNSIKSRLQNKFNISVAEVDQMDKWQRATLGVAMVSNERKILDTAINRILEFVEQQGQAQVIDHIYEVF